MHFEDVLAAVRDGNPQPIDESWSQGRTTFGGLTAAILCEAASADVDPARRMRTIDIGFVRPLEPMKPFEIEVETIASGRTVTMQSVRIRQEDKTRATAKADFVLPIESAVHVATFEAPALKPRAESIPMRGGPVPGFVKAHFDSYLSTAALPFTGQPVPEIGGWMRFQQASKVTEAHLLALIDAWPPTVAPFYEGFRPLSTIAWNVHFAEPPGSLGPEDYVGYLSKVNYAEDSLSSTLADVWTPDGKLLAKSLQTTLIYG